MTGRADGLRATVVAASNRAAAGVYEDTTGPLIVEALTELGFDVTGPVVVPDGEPVAEAIRTALAGGARAVLTTGGTGLTPTDLTPEMTRPLLDREVPGIAEAIRAYGAAQGVPTAALAGPGRHRRGRPRGEPPRLAGRGEGRPGRRRAPARARGAADHRERPLSRFWPVELRSGRVGLRPCRCATPGLEGGAGPERGVARAVEATVPPGDTTAPRTFRGLVRDLRRQAREGRALPFAVTVDDTFAGQLTVTNIVGGSARFAQLGYWVDQRYAGRGVMPTAVAMATDYCLFEMGLHRMEVAIRPENRASLRVVEKLGFTEIGYAPRYLHIDGEWRDHRLFAITVEECPGGLLRRWRTDGDHGRQ